MTNQETLFVLPERSLTELSEAAAGKMRVALSSEGGPQPFRLLDTFDSEIAACGGFLTQTAEALELTIPEAGRLSQPTGHGGKFVADLGDGQVKAALGFVSPLRSLLPLGSGQQRRATLTLVDDEGKTRARADLNHLHMESGAGAIVASLQRLRGYDKAGDRLVALLQDLGGAPVTARTLYGHLLPDQTALEAKPRVGIARDDAAFDVANAIISAYLPVARRNEVGIIADLDTEFLHDYRIALRKIRSVLSLFKGVYTEEQTQRLKAQFSALMAPTGRLRDLDVYLLERDHFLGMLPKSLHPGLQHLFDIFAAERADEQARLAQHLQGKAYRKQVGKLQKRFAKGRKLKRGPNADRAVHDFACALIWKRYRKICMIARGITEATPDGQVHQLRVHCKKLRYLMEFFAPLFPKKAIKSLIRPLRQLQDTLGLFNDYTVQQASLRNTLSALEGEANDTRIMEIAQSMGALIVVLHHRQIEERRKVEASFAAFNSEDTQTAFRDLFKKGRS